MTDLSYRDEIYSKYVTLQMPRWLCNEPGREALNRRAIVKRLGGWLPADRDARILDLGCGPGELLAALRSAGYRNLLGVDRSPQSVSLARGRGVPVVEANVCDFCGTDRREFDVICAFDLIEHFRKHELLELLRRVRDRLAGGGQLILQTPNALSPWASFYRYQDLSHEIMLGPGSLQSILGLSGFREVEVREVAPHVHGVKSALRWMAWRGIALACSGWHLAESGTRFGGIYSKNMIARAVKDGRVAW